MNIPGNFNLAAFKKSCTMVLKSELNGIAAGTEVFITPIAENNLYRSANGGIIFDFISFEKKNPTKYSTHMVKQSFTKEVREAMSEAERNEQPIFGNLKAGETYQAQVEQVAQIVTPTDDVF